MYWRGKNGKKFKSIKKALLEGKAFEVVEHFNFPIRNGEIRKVNIMQSNGCYTHIVNNRDDKDKFNASNNNKGSWIEFGKASNYIFSENLITQYCDLDKKCPIWTIRVME